MTLFADLREHDAVSAAEHELLAQWDSDIELLLVERETGNSKAEFARDQSISVTELVELSGAPGDFSARILRPEPRAPSAAARQGTRFHSWIEDRFGQRALFDDLPGEADPALFSSSEMADLQDGFMRTAYSGVSPHAVEVPFSMVIGGRVITGRIDAVYRVGERWQVVDWKTGGHEGSDPLQLAIYRCAWAQMQAIPVADVGAAFVYVKSGAVIDHDDLPDAAELAEIVRSAGQPLLRSGH